MSTRLATQRQFIITTSAAVEAATVDASQTDPKEQQQQLVPKASGDVLTVEPRTPATPTTHAEEFEFCTEDGVVVAATLEDVMTQVAISSTYISYKINFKMAFIDSVIVSELPALTKETERRHWR